MGPADTTAPREAPAATDRAPRASQRALLTRNASPHLDTGQRLLQLTEVELLCYYRRRHAAVPRTLPQNFAKLGEISFFFTQNLQLGWGSGFTAAGVAPRGVQRRREVEKALALLFALLGSLVLVALILQHHLLFNARTAL
jgi:hypothetical protein